MLSLASFSVDIYCTLSRVGTEMRAQLLFVLLRYVYVNNFSKSIVACCVIVFICIFLFSLLCDSTWLVSVVQLKIVPVVLTQEQRCVLRHLWASRLVAHHIILFRFSATCCTANQWQAGSQNKLCRSSVQNFINSLSRHKNTLLTCYCRNGERITQEKR